MNVVEKLSISSFLFGNHPKRGGSAGGNVPLGVQPSSSVSRRCCNMWPSLHERWRRQRLCRVPWLRAPISVLLGELEPVGSASGLEKQGLMLSFHKKQGGWRWTCIPWEASQTEPGER